MICFNQVTLLSEGVESVGFALCSLGDVDASVDGFEGVGSVAFDSKVVGVLCPVAAMVCGQTFVFVVADIVG